MHNILIGLLLLIASGASALPFTNADAFIDGDGQAICEIDSGLFWLDFGITNNKSFEEIQAELDTTYAGWRLPTEQEVKNLWNGLWLNGHMGEHGYRMDAQEKLERDVFYDNIFSLWGFNETWLSEIWTTEEFSISDFYNYANTGMFLNEENQLQSFHFAQISASVFSAVLHESYAFCCNLPLGTASAAHSTLLVKDGPPPVYLPEPMPVILFGFSLLMLTVSRFKRTFKKHAAA